jgi:hypothetical protein
MRLIESAEISTYKVHIVNSNRFLHRPLQFDHLSISVLVAYAGPGSQTAVALTFHIRGRCGRKISDRERANV